MSAYIQPHDEFNDILLHVAPVQPWMNWRYIYDQLNATAHCRVSTVSIKKGRKGLYAIVRILDCDPYLADFLREERGFSAPASFDNNLQVWSYWKIGQYKTPATRTNNVSKNGQTSRNNAVKPTQLSHEEANDLAKSLLETLHLNSKLATPTLIEPTVEEDLDTRSPYQSVEDVDEVQEPIPDIVYDQAELMKKPPAKRVRVKK